MNYDRFLTRVYDKQEKRMLYPGAGFSYNNELFIFRGITDGGIQYTKEHRSGTELISTFYILPFYETKDRFVPMMCIGLKDKNDKLIYEGDIIDEINNVNEVFFPWIIKHASVIDYDHKFTSWRFYCSKAKKAKRWLQEGEVWRICDRKDEKNIFVDAKIVGNIYANLELMEVKA